MDKKFPIIAIGILVIVAIATGIGYAYGRSKPSFRGSVINPPLPAPDFTLTDQSGTTGSLSNYRGKYILMYFGYTHCKSECPATMAVLHLAVIQLAKYADRIQVVFVTTDPTNDTPEAINTFLNRFDPAFVGFTGDLAVLQKIWSDYGVTVLDNGETHSSIIYLINPLGEIQITYPLTTVPDDIVSDLGILLKR